MSCGQSGQVHEQLCIHLDPFNARCLCAHAKEFDLFTGLTVTDTFIWAFMLQVINALHEKSLTTCVYHLLNTLVHPK